MFINVHAEGRTPVELRASFMKRLIGPLAGCVFDVYENADVVHFAVAQYWNDNADDEVHFKWWVGEWPQKGIYEEEDGDHYDHNWGIISKAQIRMAQKFFNKEPNKNEYVWISGYENEMVRAFASFCTEGGSQDQEFPEPYTPYAIFRTVDIGEEDALVAADYLLEKDAIPRGAFGDWELCLQNGIYVGTAPRRVIDELAIGREAPVDASVLFTTEIVGKVLRPEWESR